MIDTVFLEILLNRLQGITQEMAEAIVRTAYSPFIKETWDLAALLVTPEGEVCACPRNVSEKRLGMYLDAALAHIHDEVQPGDVFISNDPVTTAGLATHLPDLYLWRPCFVDGELVCYALCFIHISDIGGMVPGSISPTASERVQEGLVIPPSRLYTRGKLNAELRDLILANVRTPERNWGDLCAVLGGLQVAIRRIDELVHRYGLKDVREGINALLNLGETRARDIIRTIPDGVYPFVDYLDGTQDGRPIRIQLSVVVRDSDLTLDFSGTDMQVLSSFNLPTAGRDGHWTLSRAVADLFQTVDPAIPWNNGLVRPVKVIAPRGSLLNPNPNAAIGTRVATFLRIYYMVLGALAGVFRPARLASGPGSSGIMLVAARNPVSGDERIGVAEPLFGGSGAREQEDGYNGTDLVSSYLRNIPIESLEQELPVSVVQYGLRPDSGGPGAFRGGLGTEFEVVFQQDAVVTIRALQRYKFRAWGVDGGQPGALGYTRLNPGTPDERDIGIVDVLRVKRGDRLRVGTPGGGGLGDPALRDRARLAADLEEGFVTGEGLAAYKAPVQKDPPALLFGPEREAYEKRWTPQVYAVLRSVLDSLSPSLAITAQPILLDEVERLVLSGQAPTLNRLNEALETWLGHALRHEAREA